STLKHRFQCKLGTENSVGEWSKELWLAQGIQLVDLGWGGEHEEVLGLGEGGDRAGVSGSLAEERLGLVAAGENERRGQGRPPRVAQVQLHVMERAGTFVMSIGEATFGDGCAASPEGQGREGQDMERNSLGRRRELLERWSRTVEQQVILRVHRVTVSLLDDSRLLAVTSAPRLVVPRGAGAAGAGDHGGGSQEWPRVIGGILRTGRESSRSTAEPPSSRPPEGGAAMPSIASLYVNKAVLRHWQGAPPTWTGMSALDVEGSAHLRGHRKVDACAEGVQVDNHVLGSQLPVVFRFQKTNGEGDMK
ncbi:unnamed protein product, partial [Discosporangium mesarthrocarpum]